MLNKKLLILILLGPLLTGCQALKDASTAYSGDYDSYQRAWMACIDNNKHSVQLQDSGGNPLSLTFAAGNCDDIAKPQHGGQYVSELGQSGLNTVGVLGGAVISGEYNKSTARIQSRTAVEISRNNLEAQKDDNATTRALIAANQELVTQVLTPAEDVEESEDD